MPHLLQDLWSSSVRVKTSAPPPPNESWRLNPSPGVPAADWSVRHWSSSGIPANGRFTLRWSSCPSSCPRDRCAALHLPLRKSGNTCTWCFAVVMETSKARAGTFSGETHYSTDWKVGVAAPGDGVVQRPPTTCSWWCVRCRSPHIHLSTGMRKIRLDKLIILLTSEIILWSYIITFISLPFY